jgi:hypothetical protein
MDNFFKSFSRSYIISSALPATMFALMLVVLFQNFSPAFFLHRLTDTTLTSSFGIALGVVFTFSLAYTLFASRGWIDRFFVGDFIPGPIRNLLIKFGQWRYRNALNAYSEYLKPEEVWEKENPGKLYDRRHLYVYALKSMGALWMKIPMGIYTSEMESYPTDYGQAIQAALSYAKNLYGLDGEVFFVKLDTILPKHLSEAIEDTGINTNFLLNSSLLSYGIFFIAYLLVGANSLIEWLRGLGKIHNATISLSFGFTEISPIGFLIIGALFLLVGYGFYRLAVGASRERSILMRIACDSCRHDLLKTMGFQAPKKICIERKLWRDLNELYSVGEHLGMKYDIVEKYRVVQTTIKPIISAQESTDE